MTHCRVKYNQYCKYMLNDVDAYVSSDQIMVQTCLILKEIKR